MIPRYSRPQIEKIWSLENKFSLWLKIECLVAEKQSMDGLIPKEAGKDIIEKSSFNIQEIETIEKETKHDFIAFINNVSNYIGKNAKYFHHGLTSSDIIDTAFSIQLKQSSELIIDDLENYNRGIYTGSIGHIKNNGEMNFNIAIRTMYIDNNIASYPVGGGIVWDSNSNDEWNEAQLKSKILAKAESENGQ